MVETVKVRWFFNAVSITKKHIQHCKTQIQFGYVEMKKGKMIMKKFIYLLLAMLICISLVACEKKPAEETEKIDPVAQAKQKLSEIYNSLCESSTSDDHISLGYDNMSLIIDTKPNDSYYSYEDEALTAIAVVNSQLGLPSSLLDKMSSTRALDGIQTQDCGDYTVTWNYHPDNGMKVIYEINPR